MQSDSQSDSMNLQSNGDPAFGQTDERIVEAEKKKKKKKETSDSVSRVVESKVHGVEAHHHSTTDEDVSEWVQERERQAEVYHTGMGRLQGKTGPHVEAM